jgi:hypothetical protein
MTGSSVDPQPAGDHWLPAGPGSPTLGQQPLAVGN